MPRGGRNFPEGCESMGSTVDWKKMAQQALVIRRKRGRPVNYSPEREEWDLKDCRTPFETVRYLLELERKEWAARIGYGVPVIGKIESGQSLPNVALAKRMIEEARKEGLAVTLDELYQHVIPYGLEEATLREA